MQKFFFLSKNISSQQTQRGAGQELLRLAVPFFSEAVVPDIHLFPSRISPLQTRSETEIARALCKLELVERKRVVVVLVEVMLLSLFFCTPPHVL